MNARTLSCALCLGFAFLTTLSGGETQQLPPLVPPGTEAAPPKEPENSIPPAQPAPYSIWSRITLEGEGGNGVGFTRGFTLLEAFVPVWRPTNNSVVFADVRGVNFDSGRDWGVDAGGVARAYCPLINCVLGVNAFYDGRFIDQNYFNQVGVGFEALGKYLEFRANGYFVVGDTSRLVSDTGVVNLGVVGNNTVFNQFQVFDVARSGIEAEVGAPVPLCQEFAYTRAYAAFYSFSAPGVSTANGVRGRIESQITDRVALHFSVQNDRVFNTTVMGGLSISFGAPVYRHGSCEPNWCDILHQRVYRDPGIVVSRESFNNTTMVPLAPVVEIPE